MAILDSLNLDYIPYNILDGWINNLRIAVEYNIDLTAYENTINASIANHISEVPSALVTTDVTIPIVFHAVLSSGDSDIISPSTSNDILLNVNAILSDINAVYSAAGVTFCPVVNTPEGAVLDTPGLNVVQVDELVQTRFDNNGNRYYENIYSSGVTITEAVLNSQNIKYNKGVTLDYLYSNLSWPSDKVVNVFLVNGFSNSIEHTHTTMSSNPWVYDMLPTDSNFKYFNITLPFWALGNPYLNEDSPGYGYAYYNNSDRTSLMSLIQNITNINEENIINYYYSASSVSKPLLKSLGHLLGLANSNNFNNEAIVAGPSAYNRSSCNNKCVYTGFYENDFCGDCNADTITSKFHSPLNEYDLENHSCDDSMDFIENAMSDYKSPTSTYNLSANQILRIKSNLGLNYIDGRDVISGVLDNLINSPYEVLCNTNNNEGEEVICNSDEVRVQRSSTPLQRMQQNYTIATTSNNNIQLESFRNINLNFNLKEYFKKLKIINNITNRFL
jgi:hypothetical protein